MMNEQTAIFGLVMIGAAASILLIRAPILGLYASYFILWLMPSGALHLDLPWVFRSPLNVVALVTAFFAFTRFATLRRRIPASSLYLPITVCILLLITYTIVGHGSDTGKYLELMVKALWPFFMVVLLVDTPKQARKLLVVVSALLLLQVLLLLPSQIAQASFILKGYKTSLRFAGATVERGGVLPSILGRFSWQTVYTYALVSPIFLALYFLVTKSHKRLRNFSLLSFIILALSIVLGGYLRATMALILGTAVILQITPGLIKRRYIRWLINFIIVFWVLYALIRYTPGGEYATSRIAGYRQDASIAMRLEIYGPVWSAFFENPLFGWGLYNEPYQTPRGGLLDGHAGFIFICASFGILFILPLMLLLWRIWTVLDSFSRFPLSPLERALIVGFKGTYIVYIAEFIIEGNGLGVLTNDFIMLTIAGLAVVWAHWFKSGRHNRLLE